MEKQVSIREKVKVNGVNLYNGRKNSVTFHPAEENTGLVFFHYDTALPASLEYAVNKGRAIRLDNGRGRIQLIEHVLSTVYALGIDNLVMELSDGVCPTVTNCAAEYISALEEIRRTQEAPKQFWRYAQNDKTSVRSDRARTPDQLTVRSAPGFTIDYYAYYPHVVVGHQRHRFHVDEENYKRDIAHARPPTFLKNALFKHATLFGERIGLHGVNDHNYLLITSQKAKQYANSRPWGVRYAGVEFVRHKILDVLGTLALSGRQFLDTEFKFEMTGHEFDVFALKRLFENRSFVSQTSA